MKSKSLYIVLGIITFIIVLGIVTMTNREKNSVQTSVVSLSNKKIEWGIKRTEDNKQPELGKINEDLINKYEGIAIGNKEKKILYLTFDAGYEEGYTENILNILKENNVKAAFFITGHYLNSASDLVKRMIEEGHIVGNHTVNHYSMPNLEAEKLKDEIMGLHTNLYEKFEYEMKYIRPPKGEYSEQTLSLCKSIGYKTVMWSFAYDDWDINKQGREEYAKEKILKNLHNGEVILLHATSKDNANILDQIIKQIKDLGYEFKNLDEFKK